MEKYFGESTPKLGFGLMRLPKLADGKIDIEQTKQMVDMFMDACDCIITKPGGLTTSEALTKQIPMIMNNPIPGQEDRNVEFLLNAGAAMKISSTNPLDEAVYQMFINDEHRELMQKSMKLLAKPNAAENLVQFVIDNA